MSIRPGEQLMYIGGAWVEAASGRFIDAVNPTTEQVIGQIPAGGAEDVERAVTAARTAAPAWASSPWTERAAVVRTLAVKLLDRCDVLAEIDARDAGLPLRAMRGDVRGAATELEYFAGLGGELKGFTGAGGGDDLSFTVREPYGVVGRIVPFNHPLRMVAGKVAAPLMAGNCVIVKPPEQASLSAIEFARIVDECVPPGVVNIVTGVGIEAGAALAAHPGVPRITFMGSVATGRAVLCAGAEHIKHVTLELGGKNPLVVFPDADPRAAAAGAVAGMNLTSTMGQSCMSTSRVFVHGDLEAAFVAELQRRVEDLRLGDPLDEATDMGPLAFEGHYRRVMGHIERGLSQGAKLLSGGRRPDHLQRGFFVEPTIFVDVQPTMDLAREEIFGPVIAVIAWSDEGELEDVINSSSYGLTASIWTSDLHRAHSFAHRVQAGLVWINGSVGKPLGFPFGGYKHSGIGSEGSIDELKSFTREKAVIVSGTR